MNQLGMIVDLSHAAESTFWHVLRVSDLPVMASHSNARALSPHFRNLTDAQIRALGARGGLIGVNFFSSFLDPTYYARRQAAEESCKQELDALERDYGFDYPRRTLLEAEVLRGCMGTCRCQRRASSTTSSTWCAWRHRPRGLGSDFDGTNAPAR
jgi:microsomal dipeptidase-like Zn-dependent dipeptidase